MPTVRNTTDKEVCVRTGKDNHDYVFYFVPAKGSIKVGEKEAKLIAKRIKQTKTQGVTVSKHLSQPVKVVKPDKKEEASTEIA